MNIRTIFLKFLKQARLAASQLTVHTQEVDRNHERDQPDAEQQQLERQDPQISIWGYWNPGQCDDTHQHRIARRIPIAFVKPSPI